MAPSEFLSPTSQSMNNYSLTLNNPSESSTTDLQVDLLGVKKAALILRALNHKLRQQILRLIDENGRMTVTELYLKLRLEQSVASQHLAILRKAGFVNTDRDGKFIYYSVNINRMEELNKFIAELLN
jgi:DNA-binding transcriptional ArsR family regulator